MATKPLFATCSRLATHLNLLSPFGFKGGKDQPPHEYQLAEALIANDKGLREIGEIIKSEGLSVEKSVDRARLLTANYLIQMFGNPDDQAQMVFSKLLANS